MSKRSRLAVKNVPPDQKVRLSNGRHKMAAKSIWILDTKSVRKMSIQILDSSVFGGLLYWDYLLRKNQVCLHKLDPTDCGVDLWVERVHI
jgi:hypothetical protein